EALDGKRKNGHGPEQNDIQVPAKHFKRAWRQRDALFEIFFSAPIELDQLQSSTEDFIDAPQDTHGFTRDIDPDPVSGYDCNTFHSSVRWAMTPRAFCTPRQEHAGATLSLWRCTCSSCA